MPRAHRLVPAALAALGAASGCLHAVPPPAPPPAAIHGTLAIGAARAPGGDASGPLQVVFGGPSGETTQATEATIVFNKSMRKLGISPHDPPPPAAISPGVPGSWDWVGQKALRFTAAAPLPGATTFHVEVPKGTRALDGTTLQEAYALTFSTPRPTLVSSSPNDAEDHVIPAQVIELSFSQPVSDAEAERAVTLLGGAKGAPIAFSAHRDPKHPDPRTVELSPTSPLPRSAKITVRVDPSLRGEEGPLPMGKAAEISFRTIDPPRALEVTCEELEDDKSACDPRSPIGIHFNNSISERGVRAIVSVEPKVAIERSGDFDYALPDVNLSGDFKPGKTYRIQLRPSASGKPVLDEYGQPLTGDFHQTIRIGDLRPDVSFDGTGVYWVPRGKLMMQVATTNVSGVAVTASPRSRAEVIAALETGEDPALTPPPPSGIKRFNPPDPPHNERTVTRFPLADLLSSPTPHGPVLIQASYRAGSKSRTSTRELLLTDLGVNAKVAPEQVSLWVTRFTTGAPVDKARVVIHRLVDRKKSNAPASPPPITATTDAMGMVTIPTGALLASLHEARRLAIFVEAGDDWTYQTAEVPGVAPAVGSIFTERGLYRPGEDVGIKGILRLPRGDGLTTPIGREVSIKIEAQGTDTPIAAWTTPLSPFGTFDRTVSIPRNAPVGAYAIEATLGGVTVHGSFAVQEYRPTEISVEVEADRAAYIRGDTLTCTAQGRYLHGGTMRGAGAEITAYRREASFVPPGLEGFVVGERTPRFRDSYVGGGSGTLDAQGRFLVRAKLDMPGQEAPETITCNTSVEDLNREALTASTTALVHPGEFYLGLVPPVDREVRPGTVIRPGVVAADPAGVRRVVSVREELIRRSIEVEPSGAEREVETPLGACEVKTARDPVGCALTVPQGPYGERDALIVRATATDRRGNTVVSAYEITPSERRSPPPRPTPPEARDFEVSLDRREYQAGDTAQIHIRSPFTRSATAWITAERESVIASQEVAITAKETTIPFPITAAMVPNAQIHVSLIQDDSFRRDTLWLEVDPGSRRLTVALHPSPTEAAPGDGVDVDVEVKDAAGAPARAEVALFAADEGTLSLIRYRTPDPIRDLFHYRSIRVNSSEARDEIFHPGWGRHRAEPPSVRMGATSVSPPRFDFRQTVIFAPHLVTDASGHVRQRVKLPDGLTTYRFMAVAVAADDRFGSAESHVTTNKPLMARATLPRVMRAGDKLEASVVISTKDLPTAEVDLAADVQGITLVDPPRRTLALAPGEPVEARFSLRADRPGKVAVTFRATARSGKKEIARDAVALSGEVIVPIVPEAAAISGDTRSAAAEQLGDLSAIRGDYGALEIELSRTPLAGLAGGMDQLLEYPYGCTEQLVSRMIPMLALRDLARPLGVKLPDDVPSALADAVKKISDNQRPDGGFGLWPTSSESDPWISAYALSGLAEAKKYGVAVPPKAIDRAVAYLEKSLAILDAPPKDGAGLGEAAFAIDVLAGAGKADPARTKALFERRADLPLSAKASLLHALAISGGDAAEIAEVRRDVEASLRIDGPVARAVPSGAHPYAGLLDSEVRTSATALRALSAVDPAHPLATRLALGLLADRRGGTWRSTQETASALIALDAHRRAQAIPPPNFDARVFLGGSMLAEAPFHGESSPPSAALTVPIAELVQASGAPITFAAVGQGDLHYEARLRFARKALPDEPMDGGFFVQKSLRVEATAPGTPKGTTRAPGTFGAGDLIACEVVVVTPSPRHYVVVDDPIPGGFEPADAGLRGATGEQAAVEQGFATRRELRDDRVLYFIDHLPAGIYRYRYLARATTIGTFVLPPTRVEEMYVPETFGATAAQTVQIRQE